MLQKGSGHQAFVQRQPDATWPPEQEVSLRLFDGQYSQTASAPNFQGGAITLCGFVTLSEIDAGNFASLKSRRGDGFAPCLHRRGPEGSVRSC
jgi:hypothetical protein